MGFIAREDNSFCSKNLKRKLLLDYFIVMYRQNEIIIKRQGLFFRLGLFSISLALLFFLQGCFGGGAGPKLMSKLAEVALKKKKYKNCLLLIWYLYFHKFS